MRKYLKKFQLTSEYTEYINSKDVVLPNVSYIPDEPVVKYKGKIVPYILCKYNVTDISSPTKLCYSVAGFTNITIDGVAMETLSTGYTFDTTGEHNVKYFLPESIPTIGNEAFSYCSGLTEVTIGSGVTSIGSQTFYYCKSLTGVTIPNSVTSIGGAAFYYCTSLSNIVCNATTAPGINSNTFSGVKYYGTLTYPEGSDYSSWLSTDSDYLGYYNWNQVQPAITAKYNITNTSSPTKLCYDSYDFTDIIIDGVPMYPLNTGYTFTTTGEHTVEFKMKNYTIGNATFSGCTSLTGSLVIPDSVTSLGNSAFTSCSGLTELVIGSGVTSIGGFAFDKCSGLTEVTIGSGVTKIGNYAFSGCTSLTGITIPDSVTSIEYDAFVNCSGLTDLTIGSGVTEIGNDAFSGCRSLSSITCHATTAPTISSGTFRLVKYYGTLIYPEGSDYSSWLSTDSNYLGYYNWNQVAPVVTTKYNVTDISSPTRLYYSESVAEIIVDGVPMYPLSTGYTFNTTGEHNVEFILKKNVISNQAFSNCSGLTEVTIGSGVTEIGERAFYYCTSLTGSLVIPDSVTSIGNYAFYNCKSLTGVTIPDSVSTIGGGAFYYCTGLTEVTIGSGVTRIGSQTFSSCNSLTGVTIPDSVTSIGESAFSNCSGLTEVTIPDSVTSIGNYAFSGCTSFNSVTIGSGVTEIGRYVFYKCAPLSNITCNATIAPTISSGTFSGVKYFGTLTYPEGSDYSSWMSTSSDYLGYYRWNQEEPGPITCTYNVTNTSSPTKLCYVSTSYFADIIIDGVPMYPLSTAYTFTTTGEHIVEFKLKNYIINDSAFTSCSALSEVVIGSGITSIGNDAFRNCSGLTEVTIGSGVTSIGKYAFRYCTSLTGITIPDSVTTIGNTAFENCASLTGITIPDSVTSIEYSAFSNCTGLTEVTIGSGVTTIGSQTFYNCTSLTGVTIPDSVTSIVSYAFCVCSGLTEVTIGSGVTSIGDFAFSDCTSLSSITCNAINAPTISSGTFSKVKLFGTLTYPEGSDYSSWMKTDSGYLGYYNWNKPQPVVTIKYNVTDTSSPITMCNSTSGFTDIIIDGEPMETMSTGYTFDTTGEHTVEFKLTTSYVYFNTFSGVTSLNSVTIDSATSIASSAFRNCSGLTEVTIGSGVISIGYEAFSGCTSLTGITIPDSVTSIGNNAFSYCTGLTDLTIGSGVTSIGNYAFYNCTSLTGVTTPDSVTSIGYYAFCGCSGLTEVTIGSGVTEIERSAFYYCTSLTGITCHATIAPTIDGNAETFRYVKINGTLTCPEGSDYSSWMKIGSDSYLGYYNWSVNRIGVELPELTLDGYDVAVLMQPITTTSTTKIYGSSLSAVTEMSVDGVALATPATGYTFSTAYDWHVIRYKFTDNTIPASAFSGTTRIYKTIISDSVTSIGKYAFYQCSGLTEVTIGSGVTEIGNGAFSSCKFLTDITIPDSVTSIGERAFDDCSGLTEVTIGSGVTSIGNDAFAGCTGLTEVTIPDSVTSIGGRVFQDCSSLSSIVVSSGNTVYDSRENCNCIIEKATNTLIQGCNNSFIPDSVITIGNYAFSYCRSLTGITIPDSVTTIGSYAFEYCSSLTDITIPDSVTSIGYSTFYYCTSLTGITIPNSVTSIGGQAFQNCSGLTEVTIGSGVTEIGSQVFNGCSSLSSIMCHAVDAPTIVSYTFQSIKQNGTLIYPKGSDYSSWMSNSSYYLGYHNWFIKEMGIELPELTLGGYDIAVLMQPSATGETKIYGGSLSAVTEMSVDGVALATPATGYTFSTAYDWHVIRYKFTDNTIPASAFSGTTRIYKTIISDSVTSIGDYAFTYCSGLTEVTIGSGVTSIGSYAFRYCDSLTGITCHAVDAPTINSNTFRDIKRNGVLYVPGASDYSSWMKYSSYYLGYYNWSVVEQ